MKVKRKIGLAMVTLALVFGSVISLADTEPTLLPFAAGEVGTVVGTGFRGFDDGTYASFNLPAGLVAGGDGYLYVADTFNNKIRRISPNSYAETIAGAVMEYDGFGQPAGLHLDGYLDDALFNRPGAIVVDARGRMFIADSYNHVIRMVDNGTVYTFSGSGEAGHRNGIPSRAMFYYPSGLALDARGNLYVADTGNHSVRRICGHSGRVTTVAGWGHRPGANDGRVTQASFDSPMGIAVCRDSGTIYVSDTGNHLIRSIYGRYVKTLAGEILYFDYYGYALGGLTDGYNAQFNMPMGLDLYNGILFVADSANHSIRGVEIDSGQVFTVAGSGIPGFLNGSALESRFHFPMEVTFYQGILYVVDSGNNLIRRVFG